MDNPILVVTAVRCSLARNACRASFVWQGLALEREASLWLASVPFLFLGREYVRRCCCAFVVFALPVDYRQFLIGFWGLVGSACTSGFACLSESSVFGEVHRSLLFNSK